MHTLIQSPLAAIPPYTPQRRSPLTALRQYGILLRVSLAEYRRSWFFHLIRSLLFPIAFLFLVKTARGTMNSEEAIFLLGGSLTASLAFGATTMLTLKIGWGRQNHEFDYWAVLPVEKLTLLLALMSVGLFFALPGFIGVYFLGCVFVGLPWLSGLVLLPLVPLGALSLAGLAAFLGTYAPNGQATTMIVNIMTIFIGFFSPLLIPLNALPVPLHILNLIVPLTYIADVFRAALGGHTEMNVTIDVLILLAFVFLFLFFVHHKLDWRR